MNSTPGIALFALRENLRQSMWFLPTLLVVSGAALAIILVIVDHEVLESPETRLVFGGGPEGAREVISAVAGSMVAFIGTVFSITVIVLQLASSQFSPRALRSFLRDRRSQAPLGIFLATLVYAMVVLWTIRAPDEGIDGGFVPHLAISGAYVMVLVSLATFVYYIHHVSQSIRVANVVHRIGAETSAILDERYPDPFDPELDTLAPPELRGTGTILPSSRYGVVLAIDQPQLAAHARKLGGRVEVLPYVGDFVPVGSPLARWTGDAANARRVEPERYIQLGRERTMEQDIGFGIRQLVDIAEKALSPSLNDPTTATQALDQVHNVLRQLAHRSFPHEVLHDDAGVVRVVTHERDWNDIVHLAFDEIREYGAESRQVQERLRSALEDLASSVPEQRRAPVTEQLDELARHVQVRPR